MQTSAWFAIPQQLHVEALAVEPRCVTILASTEGHAARCPECGCTSRRVHSRYRRRLADLPWGGVPMRLCVTVRKLFCDNPLCRRKVFAERLEGVAQRYARRTDRQRTALEDIGLALGGRAGARLAVRLGLLASRDTLLRLVRRLPLPLHIDYTPRMLGVDDWCIHKPQRYGTILVDLDRRPVVDLLPDRSADALAAWLECHPGVEVITRDGSNTYADGASRGAPEAVQVADRFHLVANLREALRQLLERNRGRLPPMPEGGEDAPSLHPALDLAPLGSYGRVSEREERKRQESRARRLECYERMIELRRLGWSIKRIAAEVGISARTIERWLAAGCFPERKPRAGDRSQLDEYKPYLDRRWGEDCHRVAQLCREIREQGYLGSGSTVYEYAAHLRTGLPPPRPALEPGGQHSRGAVRTPSPRRLSWLLLRREEELSAGERGYLDRMADSVADIAIARSLGQGLVGMVRGRERERLDGWIEEASAAPPELRAFTEGLKRDKRAVGAALSQDYSNGQTEGVLRVTRVCISPAGG
ncbi:MAG: ISL3 family transposase [Chloroflexota bacterium]|nr:ISL3 family transposase [Chloroflexota bacterium]